MQIQKTGAGQYTNYASGTAKPVFCGFQSFKSLCNNPNIKIVFSDIDGTISKHSDMMTQKTINAVDFYIKEIFLLF